VRESERVDVIEPLTLDVVDGDLVPVMVREGDGEGDGEPVPVTVTVYERDASGDGDADDVRDGEGEFVGEGEREPVALAERDVPPERVGVTLVLDVTQPVRLASAEPLTLGDGVDVTDGE